MYMKNRRRDLWKVIYNERYLWWEVVNGTLHLVPFLVEQDAINKCEKLKRGEF